MRVDDLMTKDVVAVTPATSLKEVARLLVERRIAGVPVCDDAGTVVGVVSEADILVKERGGEAARGRLLPWLAESDVDGTSAKAGARTAGEAMSSPAVTIEAGRPVTDAARLMISRSVNRLPVVSEGRLVGIVARSDLVRAFTRSDEELRREIAEDVIPHQLWIDPSDLAIDVRDGEVVVAGTVETRTEAELVAAYVRRVPGVVSVDDSGLRWRDDDLARRHSLQRTRRVV